MNEPMKEQETAQNGGLVNVPAVMYLHCVHGYDQPSLLFP